MIANRNRSKPRSRPGAALAFVGLALLGMATGGLSISSCGEAEELAPVDPRTPLERLRAHGTQLMERSEGPQEEVEVQQLLVSFEGSRGSRTSRTQAEAEARTAELFVRLLDGADLDDLVRSESDDSHPGIFTATSAEADPSRGIFARSDLGAGLAGVAWRLEPGELGVAEYDPEHCPTGFHILRRLR